MTGPGQCVRPGSEPAPGSIDQDDLHALVALALVADLDHADALDFTDVAHVGAGARLQVDTRDARRVGGAQPAQPVLARQVGAAAVLLEGDVAGSRESS